MRQCDIITDKAFEMVSLDDWVDTIRFRRDEPAGVLRVWPEAIPEREATFALDEYGPGIEMIFDHARRRATSGRLIGGDPAHGFRERYTFVFSILGDDARMRVVRENGDAKPAGE